MSRENSSPVTSLHRHQLTIPGRFEALVRARTWLVRLADSTGLAATSVTRLDLAATEALTNIITHGYRGGSDQPITLTWECDPACIRLTLCDESPGIKPRFDPLVNPIAPASDGGDGPPERGYGVFLLHMLADEVRYERHEPHGMSLTLTLARPGPLMDGGRVAPVELLDLDLDLGRDLGSEGYEAPRAR